MLANDSSGGDFTLSHSRARFGLSARHLASCAGVNLKPVRSPGAGIGRLARGQIYGNLQSERGEFSMTEAQTAKLLKLYSKAYISVVELRRALGGITFGDVLIELAKRDLPLPRAPEAGCQQRIAAARAVLFPKAA